MFANSAISRRIIPIALVASLGIAGLAEAQSDLLVRRSPHTGRATFVTSSRGAIPLTLPGGQMKPTPGDFFRQYGHVFGIHNPATELRFDRRGTDAARGHDHTTFRQVHQGIRVFSGELKVHQDDQGQVVAANGNFYPIPAGFDGIAQITERDAVRAARAEFNGLPTAVEPVELVIVDPGWYGDPPRGARLSYFVVLRDDASGRRHAFFIDAHSGEVLDDWSLVNDGLERQVLDGQGGNSVGVLVRAEGDPPVAAPADVNRAYDYAGDFYEFLFRGFAFDSVDDQGLPLVALVNSTAPGSCPNAFWSGFLHQTVYCAGMATDDIVAHEFTHGLTQFSADLIYQNQSGQLSEAFSDVFGEMLDLLNGDAAFVGPPSGEPWPTEHPTGPGTDLPNAGRTDECTIGVAMRVNSPPDIAGLYVAFRVDRLGPRLTAAGITGDLALTIPADACPAGTPLSNPAEVNGKIAVINVEGRSDCTVVSQATHAQNAGAIAAIIVAVSPTFPPNLGGIDNGIGIPLATLDVVDGNKLKAALAGGPVDVTLFANDPGTSVRWLVGEDMSIGAARDMWNPRCFFHPDSANHPYNTCPESDNGGVHFGSGVLNHAFALATDGGVFRGFVVDGIGSIKSSAAWFRALTIYLTPASDFEDAYAAIVRSAEDLVGTFPNDPRTGMPSDEMFTASDAVSIDHALQSVEMNTAARCGDSDNVVSSEAPPICPGATILFADDFENGPNGWTVTNAGPSGPPTPFDWVQTTTALPFGRTGVAWFCEDPDIGDCTTVNEAAMHTLISPEFTLPSPVLSPTLAFTLYMETEGGADGGNVKICLNGGACQPVPRASFQFNPYNGRLLTAAQGNTNPLAGEDAWTGAGGRWGTSIISLQGIASGGDRVTLRFEFGKDGCGGVTGWYLDDVAVFDCPDCDADGRADQDELRFASASNVLSNIGVGVPQSHTLLTPPLARGDVQMTLTARGDFRGTTEFVTVDINGTVVGTVFATQASDCRSTPDTETLLISAATFNQAAAGGDAVIHMVASDAVDPAIADCDGQTYITAFVEYAVDSAQDANANGLLDACEGDLDGDGDVDLADLAILLQCFAGPTAPVVGDCVRADLNSETHVNLDDVSILVGSLSGPQ